jgi:hypothetical protein
VAYSGNRIIHSYAELYVCDYCGKEQEKWSNTVLNMSVFDREYGRMKTMDYCNNKCCANDMLYNYDKHRWPSIKIYDQDTHKHVAITDPNEAYEYLRKGLSRNGTWQLIDDDVKECFKEYLNTNIKKLV